MIVFRRAFRAATDQVARMDGLDLRGAALRSLNRAQDALRAYLGNKQYLTEYSSTLIPTVDVDFLLTSRQEKQAQVFSPTVNAAGLFATTFVVPNDQVWLLDSVNVLTGNAPTVGNISFNLACSVANIAGTELGLLQFTQLGTDNAAQSYGARLTPPQVLFPNDQVSARARASGATAATVPQISAHYRVLYLAK